MAPPLPSGCCCTRLWNLLYRRSVIDSLFREVLDELTRMRIRKKRFANQDFGTTYMLFALQPRHFPVTSTVFTRLLKLGATIQNGSCLA